MKGIFLFRFLLIIYTTFEIILNLFLASNIVAFLRANKLGEYSGANGINTLHFKSILISSLFVLFIKAIIGVNLKYQIFTSIIYSAIITFIFIFPVYYPSKILYYLTIWFFEVILICLTNFILIELIKRLNERK